MRATALSLILMAVSHFAVPQEAHWTTVEEILAAVGATPILRSDIALAAYWSRLLDARIRLELEFQDLEEGGLLYRLEPDPAAVREVLVGRAGGEEALRSGLEAAGLGRSDFGELVLRAAAAQAYVEQRLRPRISVSPEEIEAAYQRFLVEEIADAGEPVPPLSAVRAHLQQILVEQKLNQEIGDRALGGAGRRATRGRALPTLAR
ncbi:MAG: hypothetical protein P8Y93_10835 [Acidobacteriota bacterium]